MPQHHPEDRVRVRNIINPDHDDIQTFFLTRYQKIQSLDINGQPRTVEIPYEKEVQWNFKDGFFFMYGGKAYMLNPGQEKTLPRFLANHCVKNQITHILNERYLKSKKELENGTVVYDRNILNNQILKKQLANEIIVGVESWFEGNDSDFDTIINKKYGGDIDSYIDNDPSLNKEDVEISLNDEEDMPLELKPTKERKIVSDSDLQKLRDECDINAIEWTEADTIKTLKDRLTKMMA